MTIAPNFAIGPTSGAAASASATKLVGGQKVNAKAWSTAQDFESVFLNSMFQNMFTGIDGEGPFGGGGGTGIWRSFLTQEYAKSFAKTGGIGLTPHIYQSLMAHQEASTKAIQASSSTTPSP